MNKVLVGSAVIGTFVLSSCLYLINLFQYWQDPEDVTYYLSRDLSETFVEEGMFYPANDLDDPLLKDRKIVLTHTMNERTSKEVVRKLLYLNSLDNSQPIDFFLSSSGGWYHSVFTIIDTFHAIEAPVNTLCIGGCYSSTALLLASGTGQRSSYPNAFFSVHLDYGVSGDGALPYDHTPDRINKKFLQATNLPEEWFPLENDREYYFTAEQALEFGVIDVIADKHPNILNDE